MEIAVRARNLEWNDDMQQRVERTLEFAVDRHKSRITRLSVCLTDLNGPRGGVDKLCHISAALRGADPVVIQEKGDDLMAIVNRAARRLAYRVAQVVRRRRIAGAPEHRESIRVFTRAASPAREDG